MPAIAVGTGFTVTTVTDTQPPVPVNVMFTVPADIPPTTPEAEPIVPTASLALLHAPYDALNTVVDPSQTLAVPVIGVPPPVTLTLIVAKHAPDK